MVSKYYSHGISLFILIFSSLGIDFTFLSDNYLCPECWEDVDTCAISGFHDQVVVVGESRDCCGLVIEAEEVPEEFIDDGYDSQNSDDEQEEENSFEDGED